MKSLSFFALTLCATGFALKLFAADPATPAPAKFTLPDPVAVVEGKEIKAADVQAGMAQALKAAGKTDVDATDTDRLHAAQTVTQNLIAQRFLAAHAAGVKVSDTDLDERFEQGLKQIADKKKFDDQLAANHMTREKLKENVREAMREERWLEDQIAGKVKVTELDAKEFFDSNARFFEQPELVRASHILINVPENATPEVVAQKRKAIDAVAERISKGESFADLAKEVSEDTGSKANGGDLNFFPKSKMVPEFAEAVFALEQDEISKPVKSKFGFHIIKLTDRKTARKVPFEEVKAKIISVLTNQQKQAAVRDLLGKLIAKSDVKNNLPPESKSAQPATSGTK